MKTTAPILLCAVFVLGGCAATMLPRAASNCGHGACKVEVTVTGCHKDKIQAHPDELVVDPKYQGPIHWELKTPGYEFTDNGIDIKQGSDDEFDGKRKDGARKFKWNNKHTRLDKVYKYDINLVDSQGRACSKDPTIMN